MELKDIKIGAPYLFNSAVYGSTAVHVIQVYREVVHFTIDGGESSRQARDFPELADGRYFALAKHIEGRTKRITAKNLQPAVNPTHFKWEQGENDPLSLAARLKISLGAMSIKDLRAYARQNYSTIGKLTSRLGITTAIIKIESQRRTEETF